MTGIIETSIEFLETTSDDLLRRLLDLPPTLRPTHFNIGEDEPRLPLSSFDRLPADLRARQAGYFLYGPSSSFEVAVLPRGGIDLMGNLHLPPDQVEAYFLHLTSLQPAYGYAALPEERVARNRVSHQFGLNQIEAWVGRRSDKWLPGLYWLNLLSDEVATRHGVAVDELASASHRYLKLGNGLHLFQLYLLPQDWRGSDIYSEFSQKIPGLFDIEVVKRRLPVTKNFLQLQGELHKWQVGVDKK